VLNSNMIVSQMSPTKSKIVKGPDRTPLAAIESDSSSIEKGKHGVGKQHGPVEMGVYDMLQDLNYRVDARLSFGTVGFFRIL